MGNGTRKSTKGQKRRNYGSGRSVMVTGYVRIWEPTHPLASKDGYVLEHRKVVFDAGIVVPPGYSIHHRNHVKDDNRLENLQVLCPSEHRREHQQVGTPIKNQYGEWIIENEEERRKRKAAIQARSRAKRVARLREDPALPVNHGAPATYSNWGCRCELCVDADKRRRRRA